MNNNFSFAFVAKELVWKNEERVLEIELEASSQGIFFSPAKFQLTIFQRLILPVTPQVQGALSKNEIIEKKITIKDIQKEPKPANFKEEVIDLTADTFGNIEVDELDYDQFFVSVSLEDELEGQGWEMWWNPRDMKFWDPPLNENERKEWQKIQGNNEQRAWEIYKSRLNQKKRRFDLFFQTTNFSDSWWNCKKIISIICKPSTVSPPQEIKELLPAPTDLTNAIIVMIRLTFDDNDKKSMEVYSHFLNLLNSSSEQEKFVIRDIPLQINQSFGFHSFTEIWKKDHFYSLEGWKEEGFAKMKSDDDDTWEDSEMLYQGKETKIFSIEVVGGEEQLRLEKVSEQIESPPQNQNEQTPRPVVIVVLATVAFILLGGIVILKLRKSSKD